MTVYKKLSSIVVRLGISGINVGGCIEVMDVLFRVLSGDHKYVTNSNLLPFSRGYLGSVSKQAVVG